MQTDDPTGQNDSGETLTKDDFPGDCPRCHRFLLNVKQYNAHTCEAIVEAADDAQVVDEGSEILIADGGETIPITLHESARSRIDSARIDEREVTMLAIESITKHFSEVTTTLEAAIVLSLGASRDFERPTPYAIATAYGIDEADLWAEYFDFRLAMDQKYAHLLARERIEYEAEARRRMSETETEKKMIADGGYPRFDEATGKAEWIDEHNVWDPKPSELREGEHSDENSHAKANAEQLALAEEINEEEEVTKEEEKIQ